MPTYSKRSRRAQHSEPRNGRNGHIRRRGAESKTNLKISNLPTDLSDMDIILGLKQLIQPMSQDSDFKKIIFKRSRSGSVSLFVKFAHKKHVC